MVIQHQNIFNIYIYCYSKDSKNQLPEFVLPALRTSQVSTFGLPCHETFRSLLHLLRDVKQRDFSDGFEADSIINWQLMIIPNNLDIFGLSI